jgi:adenylate kinase family enzyme
VRVVIIGNSGSGKSTLAQRLAREHGLAHLDLDTLAWLPEMPPRRAPLEGSVAAIDRFCADHERWAVEGCYGDLAAAVLPRATKLYFLDRGVEACIANCRARPWEPHKYESKAAQDANLPMLIDWVRGYYTRDDELSLVRHRALFEAYAGDKVEVSSAMRAS